jgi:L-2-hydroxyglutarate oxidase
VTVLEKEHRWAPHQTGRNSGVIHAGLYYPPGSLKARLSRAGSESMVQFCRDHGLAYDVCGKLIVAIDDAEVPRLRALHEQALANGLPVRLQSPEEAREREPYVRCRLALYSPTTGIVDDGQVTETLVRLGQDLGGDTRLGEAVQAIVPTADGSTVVTSRASTTRTSW